jgi:hypothetical protein
LDPIFSVVKNNLYFFVICSYFFCHLLFPLMAFSLGNSHFSQRLFSEQFPGDWVATGNRRTKGPHLGGTNVLKGHLARSLVVVAGRGQVDACEAADVGARLRQPVGARPAAVVGEHLFFNFFNYYFIVFLLFY